MKAEAKRIQQYIQPENGTTEIALMYLPSETLYMEVIRNRELGDWMNEQHVFPVSPNTLLMTLHTISLVHKWYEVATRFEKSRAELAKAQKSFDFFQNQFENVGKNLNKAQEAFETAQRHLKNYRGKVTALSGQEQLELETAAPRKAAAAARQGQRVEICGVSFKCFPRRRRYISVIMFMIMTYGIYLGRRGPSNVRDGNRQAVSQWTQPGRSAAA